MSDENKQFTMQEIEARNAEREKLIGQVFGKAQPVEKKSYADKFYNEENPQTVVRSKHLKVRDDLVAFFESHGYDKNDRTIQAIIGNTMQNLSRLKY